MLYNAYISRNGKICVFFDLFLLAQGLRDAVDFIYLMFIYLIPISKGDSDELVPPSHMRKLRDHATKSRNLEFYSVSGGGHNDTFGTYIPK